MGRSHHVFIANVVSSNLGYVLSRVCVLHETHAGLMGPVMTKAISIETALLASLPADGPELRRSLPGLCNTNGGQRQPHNSNWSEIIRGSIFTNQTGCLSTRAVTSSNHRSYRCNYCLKTAPPRVQPKYRSSHSSKWFSFKKRGVYKSSVFQRCSQSSNKQNSKAKIWTVLVFKMDLLEHLQKVN